MLLTSRRTLLEKSKMSPTNYKQALAAFAANTAKDAVNHVAEQFETRTNAYIKF